MKRSEMHELIAQEINAGLINGAALDYIAENVLQVIEAAGMLPRADELLNHGSCSFQTFQPNGAGVAKTTYNLRASEYEHTTTNKGN